MADGRPAVLRREDQAPGAPAARRKLATAGVAAVALAGLLTAWRTGVFASPSGSAGPLPAAPATAVVTRQNIAATTPLTATLGYAGSYPVLAEGGGTLTWLPPAGQVIREGQVLYRTGNAVPVVLLYGRVPDWRPLGEGLTGEDVRQLNVDLVALRDVARREVAAFGWSTFSPATAAGVQKLQSGLGVAVPDGSLPLGSVVFEPAAIRIGRVLAVLGSPATGLLFEGTSDRRVVTIPLDVSEQGEVRTGDKVAITLPDGASTTGAVSTVGAVASTSRSGGNGQTTIPVQVTLTDPHALGPLDQAPVTVLITTATADGVLVVPVGALLARSAARYEVEVVGRDGSRRLVPVTVGIFDDASGLVQVAGALTPGQRVVVPAS